MWFEKLTGFKEETPDQVRKHLYIDGEYLVSAINGHRFLYGTLETPTLFELRTRVDSLKLAQGSLTLQECVADVQELHTNSNNKGAFFQVASQFNLLEMVSPEVNPEDGVDRYALDFTQGPACAIAAGAGTIYRNYFVELNGKIGQSHNNQINTLADVGIALANESSRLWEMKNGYALATEAGLKIISMKLGLASEHEIDLIRGNLRIGIQSNTEVTLNDKNPNSEPQTVTQSYCSALPIA